MSSTSTSRAKSDRHSHCTWSRRPPPLPKTAPFPALPRSTSPTRLQVSAAHRSSSAAISIRPAPTPPPKRKTCACSPTTHPGSFRCAFHRSANKRVGRNRTGGGPETASYHAASRLSLRRSAMANSVVRIGGVEGGEWVKRALSALIRPSSHQLRRREGFNPGPSRLCFMSRADD